MMVIWNCVNIVSGVGFLPDGTKLLPLVIYQSSAIDQVQGHSSENNSMSDTSASNR